MTIDTGTRILVVDSSAPTRQVLGKFLSAQGFTSIEFAVDVASAWKTISLGGTDLVICELTIGRLHGLKLLQKLRSSKEHAALPFIMMAKTRNPRHIVAVVKAGASDFLVKPFNAATLADKLNKVLARKPRPAPVDEKRLLAAGNQLLERQDLDKALAVFTRAARMNPGSAEAFKGLAEVCRRRNDAQQFRTMAAKAAELFVLADNFAQAEAMYLDLGKYDAEAPNPFLSVGRAQLAQGDAQAAVKAFNKATLLKPGDPEALTDLARAYQAAGDKEKAETAARAALELDDANPERRKLFRDLSGKRWSDARKEDEQRRQEEIEEEKRGTVRFWVPDLLLDIKGCKHNHPLTEMSVRSAGFSPLNEEFKPGQTLHFAIVRLQEDKPEPEIKGLRAEVLRVDKETVGCRFLELDERQAAIIHDLITAVQKKQQKEAGERQNKVIKFDIDMLFM